MLSFLKQVNRHCSFKILPSILQYSTSSKATVDGVDLHFEQSGNGDHVVLLLPGALGSSKTDFGPQIDGGLDPYKVIAWDPPGYGHSRPPERTFPANYLTRDAHLAAGLMNQLGYETFSALGWSDGATTALILAAQHPRRVRRLVVWGGGAYLTPTDLKLIEKTRNVDMWSERMRAPMEAVYGAERFRILWDQYCDAYASFGSTESSTLKGKEEGGSGDLCLASLVRISCPTLVIHGDLDPMVDPVHPAYLAENIRDAKLVRFKEGKHNLHLRYAKEFNSLVKDFLSCK